MTDPDNPKIGPLEREGLSQILSPAECDLKRAGGRDAPSTATGHAPVRRAPGRMARPEIRTRCIKTIQGRRGSAVHHESAVQIHGPNKTHANGPVIVSHW